MYNETQLIPCSMVETNKPQNKSKQWNHETEQSRTKVLEGKRLQSKINELRNKTIEDGNGLISEDFGKSDLNSFNNKEIQDNMFEINHMPSKIGKYENDSEKTNVSEVNLTLGTINKFQHDPTTLPHEDRIVVDPTILSQIKNSKKQETTSEESLAHLKPSTRKLIKFLQKLNDDPKNENRNDFIGTKEDQDLIKKYILLGIIKGNNSPQL